MRKRVLKFLGIMLLLVCITSNVYASTNKSLFEFEAFENIYKLSEQTEDIKLPFFNMFLSSATYDKDVKHSGISFGQSTVEVGEKLEGLHIIFTQDMVTIKSPSITEEQRNDIIVKLAEKGIATNVHYKPLPMMTAYKNLGYDISDFPNAYGYFKNEITLPLHTKLSDEDVNTVCENFAEVVKKYI